MQTILYTGTTGLLGVYFLGDVPASYSVHATIHRSRLVYKKATATFHDLDIRDAVAVDHCIQEIRPDVIVHAAAHGIVEFCENNKEEADATNIRGTRNLLAALNRYGGRILFFSTNATFDGYHAPYTETDEQLPANYYGLSKVQSEKDIIASKVPYTIVRLMTMYGWNSPEERKNPVSWGIEALQKGEPINMVTDVWNNFLYAKSAAQATWEILNNPKTIGEIIHLSGATRMNRYELLTTVATTFSLNPGLVSPVTSDFFTSHVQRAPDTTFSTKKMKDLLGVPVWSVSDGLEDMRAHPILPSDFAAV